MSDPYNEYDDTERLNWFIENIVEWKLSGYDGMSRNRFDVFWPNDESDLRKAIDNELRKKGKS